jgi:hypothetical protein
MIRIRSMLIAPVLAAVALASTAQANPPIEVFHANLNGFNELGVTGGFTGAIFTQGHGNVEVVLDRVNQVLHYSLTFSDASSTVEQAHIHFGKVHVTGAVVVFLCSNLNNAPAGTPACPASGTVTGTITAADVIATASEGIPAGDFDVITEALDSNTAYVNVHSATFPTGEIRGQLEP